MCGRELRATEEDSTNSFICVLKKMKEMRLMEKVVEETEEVRKLGGCWDMAGGLVRLWRVAEAGREWLWL